jgi:hypothetical protein
MDLVCILQISACLFCEQHYQFSQNQAILCILSKNSSNSMLFVVKKKKVNRPPKSRGGTDTQLYSFSLSSTLDGAE